MLSNQLSILAGGSLAYGPEMVTPFYATGDVIPDAAYIDIELPANFSEFELRLTGFTFNDTDFLAAAFSFDGGVTWLNDTTNFDSYASAGANFNERALSTTPANNLGNLGAVDGTMGIFGDFEPTQPIAIDAVCRVVPGDVSRLPVLITEHSTGFSLGAVQVEAIKGIAYPNPYATVAPTRGRATTLRLLPYGNGDVAPPTSTHVLATGRYTLWGIP